MKQFNAAVTIFLMAAAILSVQLQFLYAQQFSSNTPHSFESNRIDMNMPDVGSVSALEINLKEAMEDGDDERAGEIRSELLKIIGSTGSPGFQLMKNEELILNPKAPETPAGDWLTANSLVTPGTVKSSEISHKQIDMKFGEDNNLYALVNGNGSGIINGYFFLYKSTDMGRTWTYLYSVGSGLYIGTVSLLVESKSNAVADSTRLIVFYTTSSSSDMSNAKLNFFSLRSDASAISSGTVILPAAGKKISHISPVSDGAYWQGATYFGAVYSEEDNSTGIVSKTGFVRTIDWGVNWTSSSLSTGYDDHFPSADYKEGSSDSVYIAVERRFSAQHSEIRVIATRWIPSSAFYTYYLTVAPNTLYRKPCITIKQEGIADSIMVTTTKNGMPVYHYTTNGGGAWITDAQIASANGSNKIYTYCSSSPGGNNPFSVCWLSAGGDSLNVRRGSLGSLGSHTYRVNSQNSLTAISPVCVTVKAGKYNNNAAGYAGSPAGVYLAQEGLKDVSVKVAIQGFYKPAINKLSISDTVRIYFRSLFNPFAVIDSGIAVVNSETLTADFSFSGLNDGGYYLVVKHRNSLETWSAGSSFVGTGPLGYDFAAAANMAFGNNLVQVDNSPVTFAMYSGDVNQDGTIDGADLSIIDNSAVNFISGYTEGDLTGDNFVDGTDFSIADNNAASFVSISRP